MSLNKYPDIDSIRNHPAHRTILLSNKSSRPIKSDSGFSYLNFSTMLSTSSPQKRTKRPTKYFKLKANTPLPPLNKQPKFKSYFLESSTNWENILYQKIFERTKIEDLQKIKTTQLKTENKLNGFVNEQDLKNTKKNERLGNSEKNMVNELSQKISIGGRYTLKPIFKENNLRERLLNRDTRKTKLKSQEIVTVKKELKECDVQTNDLGYDYIIVD